MQYDSNQNGVRRYHSQGVFGFRQPEGRRLGHRLGHRSGRPAVQQAAKIAIQTVRKMVEKHPEAFDEILWVLFDERTKLVYDGVLQGG